MPAHGSRADHTENGLVLGFLRNMITVREVEVRALELTRTDPPRVQGSIHLCAGQEAVPVGAVGGLEPDDQIVATYRGHGWALASGLSLLEVLGEICHRSVGINGGRGGSAYMMAPHRRFIGENSIVGAGIPIACGIAMANRSANNARVAVVSVGDGAFNQGAAHEGLVFAAAQNLPLIVICENNGWSEMTPTALAFKVDRIAQRAAGYGILGATIDGTDPCAVMEAVKQAAHRARTGKGPALLEFRVPRLWGHYNRDIEHYRPREDRVKAQANDPIVRLTNKLIADGRATAEDISVIVAEVGSEIDSVMEQVSHSAEPDPATARLHVWASSTSTFTPIAGTALASPETREMTYIQAVNAALRRELETRPEVIVYGEDVGVAGGIFGATRTLQKDFGPERVFDTPISEAAILGSAVGAALLGLKPIVEIMWADFLLVALDQIVNQAANIRFLTSGRTGAPIVVRTQQGVTPGSCAQHSQSLEALLAHIPGLRIALPATPQDAYDLLRSAAAAADPCVVIEARALYQTSDAVLLSDHIDPIGKSRLHKSGTNAIIVTWGTQLRSAIEAADTLTRDGIDVGVLDLRWLSPLDEEALFSAVEHAAGRVVVVHEANRTAGFGAEIVSRLHEVLGDRIRIKCVRVAAPDVRIPAAPVLQRELIPNVSWIVDAVRHLLTPR
jgi:2-oxoisovalerate dehydrogenase E1 component